MARVTLTVEDGPDGTIELRFEADPELELDEGRVAGDATLAQHLGAATLGHVLALIGGAGHATHADADARYAPPARPAPPV